MSVNGQSGRKGERDDVVVRKAAHGWVVHGESVSDLTSAMVLADLFAADRAADDDTRLLEAVDENGSPRQPAERPAGRHRAGQRVDGKPPAPRRPAGWPSARAGQSPRAPQTPEASQAPQPPRAPEALGTPGAPGTLGSVRENDEASRLAVTVAQLEHALASRVRVEQAIGVLAERYRLRPREAFDLLRGAARSRGRRVTEIAQDVVASAANPLLRLPEELARKLPEPRQRGRSLRRPRHAEQF